MKFWRTRDRRLLTVECMTCEHLRNAVNKILRDRWRMRWLFDPPSGDRAPMQSEAT